MGALFDFGFLSNDVIQEVAGRAVEFHTAGHLPHPFQQYAIHHTWEGGTCLYLVDATRETGVECAAWEWRSFPDDLVPVGGPRYALHTFCELLEIDTKHRKYSGHVATIGATPDGELASVMDAVFTCRMALITRGVRTDVVGGPGKLNKHRLASGKVPIPGHITVDAARYTTAIRETHDRERAGTPHDGRSSPRPHLRRGHLRRLESGKTVVVRDCVVGAELPELVGRDHYRMG
jgi:hypothetical protein